ncbi:MAG: class I SAM-dependent methyltransferase [Chloroflexi bacterium AL-W]|nr:class I SAM-dependent methyltransferase [Chloroflexi bacterium AL-N1]NOK66520.1 class I SAM-dependent methyltransferase [Chloroflexi bacterium AL-N10]NOK71908.1 class I SAM-dependent methyltransferase [Chloroflexi bacterium AL-N5]NOK81165.1 class I SAM-dependent methyltransferase [Chloroflexi bacterium AL-W]NOK89438.1 class I SAM-dependent methyltransferase [Chloroflexi bacterium AL-N15]
MLQSDAIAGSAFYTRTALFIYDYSVLWFSNRFVWQCPTPHLLTFYNQHLTDRHLDIGVGTGYFLGHGMFPSSKPQITLIDLNRNSLSTAAKRIARYSPAMCLANILEPLPLALDQQFTSMGMGYLLHCLPRPMGEKFPQVLQHILPFLANDGVVFGATILGSPRPTGLAATFMRTYNQKRIFSNIDDSYEGLEEVLRNHFYTVSLSQIGHVGLFAGWHKRV